MFRIILSIFPALIPLIIFVIWYVLENRKKDVKVIDEFIEKRNRYMGYAIVAAGVITIVMMVMFYIKTSN